MSLATEIAGKLNYLNTQDRVAVNATLPYSGYTQVSKKLDNFVFQTSSSFLNKVADKNRYVKFGEKVVDTYGPELITNGDFSNGTTGWTARAGVSSIENINNQLKVTRVDSSALYAIALFDNTNLPLNKRCVLKAHITANVNVGKIYAKLNNGSEIELVSSTPYTGYIEIDTTSGTAYDSSYIAFSSGSTGNYITIDNISIREIQTAQFTVPNVTEIITNGSNTTTVQVNAGDYVVDGSELVTNGTFDSDINGWAPYNGATLTQENGELKITGTDIDYPYAEQTINTVIGQTYQVVLGKNSGSVANVLKVIGSTSVILFSTNEVGAKTFVATASTTKIRLENATSTNNTVSYWDNISVKQVSDTFRAKQDAPIGTALTNSAYFEDRTQIGITNQQLAYHAYNVLTNSYEGIKTEVLFSDVSKEDLLNNSVWMVRNGFSKVSEFLYSKGSYLCLPVGIWQSLNKGAYHPVFNGFGTKHYKLIGIADEQWYDTPMATDVNNLSKTFKYNNGTYAIQDITGYVFINKTGHPQGKYYDIVYPDQFIDVREYAKVLNPYEVDLIRADKEENGVEEIVAFYSGNNLATSTGASSLYVTSSSFPAYAELKMGDKVYHNGQIRTINYIGGTLPNVDIYLTETINRVANEIVILYKTKPVLSSNTKLSTDLIGNPTNYPQIMKDRLASGVGIVGVNPLLVDDLGNSLIADNDYGVYKYSNKSISALDLIDYNGTSYNKLAIVGSYALATTTTSSVYIDYGAMPSISNKATINRNTNSSVVLTNYISKNNPYIQTTPKAVVEVLPKVKASNSHSIYKGALIGNQVSGKIQVGNGSNGYESKVLENTIMMPKIWLHNTTTSMSQGFILAGIWMVAEISGSSSRFNNTLVIINSVTAAFHENSMNGWYVGSNGYSIYDNSNNLKSYIQVYVGQKDVVWLGTTHQHTTIALDNSNSPASKWFECLEEGSNGVLAGVYGQEVVYGADTGNFANLSNGTTTDFSNNTVRTFHGAIPLNGKIK